MLSFSSLQVYSNSCFLNVHGEFELVQFSIGCVGFWKVGASIGRTLEVFCWRNAELKDSKVHCSRNFCWINHRIATIEQMY